MAFHRIPYFLLLFVSYCCQGQIEETNSTYFIGEIDKLQIDSLQRDRVQADSMFKKSMQLIDSLFHDSLKVKEVNEKLSYNKMISETYTKNRSRVYFLIYKNEELNSDKDFSSIEGTPAPCICFLDRDTIYIQSWVGFFAAYGLGIKIYGNQFLSKYIVSTDQPNIYKSKLSDKKLTGQMVVNGIYQKLTLESNPVFKIDEQITGLLEITSDKFYEKKNAKIINSLYIKAKVYFSCNSRQMTAIDEITRLTFR